MTTSHQNQKEKWEWFDSLFDTDRDLYFKIKALIKQVQEEAYEEGFSDAVKTELNQVRIRNSKGR